MGRWDELDVTKLSTVLTAKYGSIHAAQEQLGSVQDIQSTFVDFQQYLYAAEGALGRLRLLRHHG